MKNNYDVMAEQARQLFLTYDDLVHSFGQLWDEGTLLLYENA